MIETVSGLSLTESDESKNGNKSGKGFVPLTHLTTITTNTML